MIKGLAFWAIFYGSKQEGSEVRDSERCCSSGGFDLEKNQQATSFTATAADEDEGVSEEFRNLEMSQ